MAASVPFNGNSTSHADFQGYQLPNRRPALGVHMVDNKTAIHKMHTLIPADAELPATGSAVYTTWNDGQTEMSIKVLKGNDPVPNKNKIVGQFDMVGLPPGEHCCIEVGSSLTSGWFWGLRCSAVYTTLNNGQTKMPIKVLKGNDPVPNKNNIVGQFDMVGLPSMHAARSCVWGGNKEGNCFVARKRCIYGPEGQQP